jgi:hypothetical protein
MPSNTVIPALFSQNEKKISYFFEKNKVIHIEMFYKTNTFENFY